MNEAQIWIEKLKIYELFSRYTLAFDRQDVDAIANCFTEDGVFGFGDRGLRGRDRIREYAKVHGRIRSRHITASPVYELDPAGDMATGQSTAILTVPTRSGYKVAFIGWYDDELKRVGDEWLISRRWVTDERLPEDPDFIVATADAEMAELLQPLLDAYRNLGEKM